MKTRFIASSLKTALENIVQLTGRRNPGITGIFSPEPNMTKIVTFALGNFICQSLNSEQFGEGSPVDAQFSPLELLPIISGISGYVELEWGESVCDKKESLRISSSMGVVHIPASRPHTIDEPDVKGEFICSLPVKTVREVFKKLKPATTKDGGKWNMHQILCGFSREKIEMTATDGFRIITATCSATCGKDATLAIPMKMIELVSKGSGDVSFGISETDHGKFGFVTKGSATFSFIDKGAFPPVHKVIGENKLSPSSFSGVCIVNSADLLSAINFLPFREEKREERKMRMCFSPTAIRAENIIPGKPDRKSTCEVPASFEGEPIEIEVNPDYVRDFLKSCRGDVYIFTKSPRDFVLFSLGEFKYLLLPIIGNGR